MFKSLLSMVLVLSSLGGVAVVEPTLSPVSVAAHPDGWGYFRNHRTEQDAIRDGESVVHNGGARDYQVRYEPHRNKYYPWAVYLLQ